MWSFTKQNKVVIEYSKRKQSILLKTNYCGCETLGENKEQNRFYRKGGIAAEAVLSKKKRLSPQEDIEIQITQSSFISLASVTA